MASPVSYLSVDRKGRATLPEKVRASLGLKAGDFVLLERTERGTYELVPAALVPRDQLWFHHPEMQGRIAKAEADLAAGRVKVAHSAGEAQELFFVDVVKHDDIGRYGRRPRKARWESGELQHVIAQARQLLGDSRQSWDRG
jgi:AbrB family looped-hinge helix DNA binding protein